MAELLDLPNELLLDVINDVCVEDIEAFTSCNKRIHSLSKDILQRHKAMKKKYSKLRLTSFTNTANLDLSRRVHPIFWLQEIMLNETVASYPIHLYIQDHPAWDEDERATDIPTESKDCMFSKLAQCPYIQRKELEAWKQRHRPDSNCFDITLALLLTLLPNLQSIIINCLMSRTFYTEYMLAQIAKAHQVDQGQRHALSRLVSLDVADDANHINGAHFGNYISPDFCLPFTGFPSFLSVSGHNCDDRLSRDAELRSIWDNNKDLPKPFESGFTKIKFRNSQISGLGFEQLLCRISTLQDFEYEYAGDPLDHEYAVEPLSVLFGTRKIVNSLSTHASHSLRCLKLTGNGEHVEDFNSMFCWYKPLVSDSDFVTLRACIFMGSLRDFQVLKDVRVNHAMFIEKITGVDTDKTSIKVHRLVDLLPASIEKLSLIGERGLCPLSDLFEGLTELKTHNVPKLETIDCDYCDPASRHLKQACHAVGIELVLPINVAA